VMYSCI